MLERTLGHVEWIFTHVFSDKELIHVILCVHCVYLFDATVKSIQFSLDLTKVTVSKKC